MSRAFYRTLLAVMLTATVTAQNTGKDSVAVETGILRFNPIMGTSDLQSLTRPDTNTRAIAWNEDTQTLWAWTGTQWIDLGIAPVAGGITVDAIIQNESTNPVENDAVHDRFITVVDEADDSPNTDVKIWWGLKSQYAVSDQSLPRGLYVVQDSIYNPALPQGEDSYITNVQVINDSLSFTAVGAAFDGTVALPLQNLINNSDNQQVTDFSFNSSTNVVTLTIERGNTTTVDLSPLFQNASEVEFNDTNVPILADDVQEAIDKLFQEGSSSTTYGVGIFNPFGTGINDNRFEGSGNTTVTWRRFGNLLYFECTVTATFDGRPGAGFFKSDTFVSIDNPLPFLTDGIQDVNLQVDYDFYTTVPTNVSIQGQGTAVRNLQGANRIDCYINTIAVDEVDLNTVLDGVTLDFNIFGTIRVTN